VVYHDVEADHYGDDNRQEDGEDEYDGKMVLLEFNVSANNSFSDEKLE